MNDILSQNEIDNILSGMNTGAVGVDDVINIGLSKKEVAAYDFRRPNRFSKAQLRTLQSLHEQFAESYSYYLVSKLQTVVSVTVTSVDQLFYSEFILSIANPSCLYVFDIEGTDGSGILEISPQLAFCMVERLLGGGTDTIFKKPRAISAIEQAVIRGIVMRALSDLSNNWRSLSDLEFVYSRLETEADFVQIAPGSEIVLVVSFDVSIGSNSYMMNLCFPTFALEEVIAQLNRRQLTAGVRSSAESRENAEIIRRQVATTYLPVIAELGAATISLGELMELKTGDIIKTGTKVDSELQLIIAGRRKLAVRPGMVDGKKSVRVTRSLIDEDIVEDIGQMKNMDLL